MIYAKLKKDDYRVKAAVDWASKHYTLKENPVMGPEGLYYYLHTFAKAHAAYGDDIIKTSDGKTHNWRQELLLQFLQTQRSKGEWYNDNGRWQESVPELVTAYALIAMEIALGPQNKD
jgi:squalene-hopene/tetraprenyl-beta-curcumene cyclase